MPYSEFWFAFVLIPVYFALCVWIASFQALRRLQWPGAFALNWIIAAIFLGVFVAMTGMARGDWLAAGLFSGGTAALIGTALAFKFRPKAAHAA